MRNRLTAVCFSAFVATTAVVAQDLPSSVVSGDQPFEMEVLASGLAGPWELTWGPDDHLWVTERKAGRILRIDPETGAVAVAVTLPDVVAISGQDGLLGLALHPELGSGADRDYAYAAYTYRDEELAAQLNNARGPEKYHSLFARIIRLSFDPESGTLYDPVVLIEGLTAGGDHNSGRLKFGPDQKLYYTIGDQGNQQFSNACVPIQSQTLPTAQDVAQKNYFPYQGKSLRINLDGSIPDDNPVLNGVQSHVFTYGHRNMQGLAFAPDGRLYGSEHGPKSDDEVNILKAGANYGWPHISGFVDDMAYQNASWPEAPNCETLGFSDLQLPAAVPVEKETDWSGTSEDPLATLFTVPSDWNFADPQCDGMYFICWPTVAPSSLDYYSARAGGIPGWENALLVPTLKRGSLYVLPLTEDGAGLRGPIERHFQSENRFRDVAISPDGQTIYVATDPGGVLESLDGTPIFEHENPGSILAFRYAGG